MRLLKRVNPEFWWEVARACPYATFFHTPLWHRLACSTYSQMEDMVIGAIGTNGTRIVMPLICARRVAKGMFQNITSTFAGCYGGIIADGPVLDQDARNVYKAACSWRVGMLQVNGNPLYQDGRIVSIPDQPTTCDFTHILELDCSYEGLEGQFSKGHKSSMKKGRRMGVTVRLAETMRDYEDYFGAYQDSRRRWGDNATNNYPWRLFKRGYEFAQEYPEHLKLWLADAEGQVVAGAWVFYWNHHVDWWHGAAYEAYLNYSPYNVLIPEIIRDALSQGYKYYDFNPSGGHEGVASFKRRFGSEKWHFTRATIENKTLKASQKVRDLILGQSRCFRDKRNSDTML